VDCGWDWLQPNISAANTVNNVRLTIFFGRRLKFIMFIGVPLTDLDARRFQRVTSVTESTKALGYSQGVCLAA